MSITSSEVTNHRHTHAVGVTSRLTDPTPAPDRDVTLSPVA